MVINVGQYTQFLTKDTKPDGTIGAPLRKFFVTVRLLSNFFVSKGSRFEFFDILQQTEVSKSPKGLLPLVFGPMRLVQNSHFSFFLQNFFKNVFEFHQMSPKGSPSFLIFCNKLDFQKVERVPLFTIIKTLRFLSLRYSADFRRFRLVRHFLVEVNQVWSPFRNSETCWKSFAKCFGH